MGFIKVRGSRVKLHRFGNNRHNGGAEVAFSDERCLPPRMTLCDAPRKIIGNKTDGNEKAFNCGPMLFECTSPD